MSNAFIVSFERKHPFDAHHIRADRCFIHCRGFDVYVNMVLEDVIEYEITPEGRKVRLAWSRGGLPILLSPLVLLENRNPSPSIMHMIP